VAAAGWGETSDGSGDKVEFETVASGVGVVKPSFAFNWAITLANRASPGFNCEADS
jgi:hypothetical protein